MNGVSEASLQILVVMDFRMFMSGTIQRLRKQKKKNAFIQPENRWHAPRTFSRQNQIDSISIWATEDSRKSPMPLESAKHLAAPLE